jgi:hypothetical protein
MFRPGIIVFGKPKIPYAKYDADAPLVYNDATYMYAGGNVWGDKYYIYMPGLQGGSYKICFWIYAVALEGDCSVRIYVNNILFLEDTVLDGTGKDIELMIENSYHNPYIVLSLKGGSTSSINHKWGEVRVWGYNIGKIEGGHLTGTATTKETVDATSSTTKIIDVPKATVTRYMRPSGGGTRELTPI